MRHASKNAAAPGSALLRYASGRTKPCCGAAGWGLGGVWGGVRSSPKNTKQRRERLVCCSGGMGGVSCRGRRAERKQHAKKERGSFGCSPPFRTPPMPPQTHRKALEDFFVWVGFARRTPPEPHPHENPMVMVLFVAVPVCVSGWTVAVFVAPFCATDWSSTAFRIWARPRRRRVPAARSEYQVRSEETGGTARTSPGPPTRTASWPRS
jgi:hypothetical protein